MTAPTYTELADELDTLPSDAFELEDEDEDDVYYYYDDENNFEKLRLRDMPGTDHDLLITYLMELLRWLFRDQLCAIYRELNFYRTLRPTETPLYPDIALLAGQSPQSLISYRLGIDGPPPNLVVEVISTKTRRKDLFTKPARYARWGTAEYFAYDPRSERRLHEARLSGWRLNANNEYERLEPVGPDGRLWSEQLNVWLVPEGAHLRLYDAQGQLLLTEAQALREQSVTERSRADKMAQLLRELGYDPDKIV